MKYNRALDQLALALEAATAKDYAKASQHLLKAASESSAPAALGILEASNAQAFRVEAKAKSPVRSSQRLRAEADGEMMDPMMAEECDPEDPAMEADYCEPEPSEEMARLLSKMARVAR